MSERNKRNDKDCFAHFVVKAETGQIFSRVTIEP